MAIPATHRSESHRKAQAVENQTRTFTMTDGRQIEYTLDGERRLLQKTDRLQRVLKERKVKWKR